MLHKTLAILSMLAYFVIALYGLALYVVARPALIGVFFAIVSAILICALHRGDLNG